MRINDWEELEDLTKQLLACDSPKKPANSGGTKKEEDVISKNIVAQCKYTDSKNMSILNKDLQRLLEACKLQEKLPLFVTSNGGDTIVSIPLNDNTIDILNKLILVMCGCNGIQQAVDTLDKIHDVPTWEAVRRLSSASLCKVKSVYDEVKSIHTKCEAKLSRLYDDLTMYNLFDN